MDRSMSRSPVLVSLCIIIAIIGSGFPLARSEHDGVTVIQQVTNKGGGEGGGSGDFCGKFAAPASCPVNCFRANPVCGVDGVTYWCGCPDATCHGTKVAKLGACEVGSSSGSSSLPGQALLLVHIVWLFLLGFSLLFGLF
uniref:Serine-type endopeptidase inhibitor n=1 Tax=Rhizophora mucronata TaxID=61149 RepID=A0A2P2NM51_RHIMU